MKLASTLVTSVILGAGGLQAQSATSVLFVGNSFTYGAGSAVQFYRSDTVTDLNGEGIGGVPALFKSFTTQAGLDCRRITVVILTMAIAHSRLTAQGQISVPARVRRKLGIGPGSVLEWDEDGDTVVVRRAGRHTSEEVHRAVFRTPPRPRTLEELKAGVRRHIRKRHASR